MELLINEDTAHELGFDQLLPEDFRPCAAGVAGDAGAHLRDYVGIVEVSITIGRRSVRSTRCANATVGGTVNLLGLATRSRLLHVGI